MSKREDEPRSLTQEAQQAIPQGMTPEAQREREQFLLRYKIAARKMEAVALSILIWGPNPESDSPVARKRNEILRSLLDDGHNAMFSEHLPAFGRGLPLNAQEFAQARACHLIIILVEGSPGALAEFHDFCSHPEVAGKIYVMVPLRYKKGYSGHGAFWILDQGFGGVYWYKDNELSNCNVKSRVLRRVRARRAIYAMNMGI